MQVAKILAEIPQSTIAVANMQQVHKDRIESGDAYHRTHYKCNYLFLKENFFFLVHIGYAKALYASQFRGR
jgi:hypothetical protein